MRRLGYKIRIPREGDATGWKRLWRSLTDSRSRYLIEERKRKVRETHDLEKFIARLERRPPDRSRSRLVRTLKRRLTSLQG
jgi:hypothetical protein